MNTIKHLGLGFTFIVLFASIFISCNKSDDSVADEVFIVGTPLPNETVRTGILFQVKWYAPAFSHVDIELYQGSNLVYTIEDNIDVRSVYDWMPLDNLPEGSDYYIKVTNSDNKSQYAISKNGFNIKKHLKEFSEFTDPLDGRVYKTTKIGNQWWMAENYSYDSEEGSLWFLNDRQRYESYGKMYTLETALKFAPPGWHLPTNDEWEELNIYLGSSIVVGLQVGGGTGFNAFPAGFYTADFQDGFFAHESRETHFCTSTVDNYSQVIRVLSWPYNDLDTYSTTARHGTYVRYVKD